MAVCFLFSCAKKDAPAAAGTGKREDLAVISSPVKELRSFGGEALAVVLQVKNAGKREWRSDGENPCYLSYHLLDGEGKVLRFDNPRTPFPRPVRPGASVEVSVKVKTPLDKGNYSLEFDIVREGLNWFKDRGSKTLTLALVAEEKSWPEDEYPLDLAYGRFTKVNSGVASFEKLVKLIRLTLSHDEVGFTGKTGEIQGFAAGSGYPQIWLRDAATTIPASRFYYPESFLTSWLEEHLAHQKDDGSLADWIDGQGRLDKNTVESDQEASAVQSAHQIFLLKGPRWLTKEISGVPLIARLERSLLYLFRERFDGASGLITGAHTADWGDIDIEDADQRAIYVDEKTHWTADIYDQSMAFQASQNLAQMFAATGDEQRASLWRQKAESLKKRTNTVLWQEDKGFFRLHRHLDRLSHDFDEDEMFGMGGNAQAIVSGLASPEQARRIILQALRRQDQWRVSTISGALLPPYPAGFFKHPAVDETYEYQNGGQWDWFGGRLLYAMFEQGFSLTAREKLLEVIRKDVANAGLYEWDTREGAGRGSDNYAGSAGSLARALFEGYFGLKIGENSLSIEPRLGEEKGMIHAYLPIADMFVAYDYQPNKAQKIITFRYNSNSSHPGRVKVLMPRRFFGLPEKADLKERLEVFRDGHKIPFQTTRLNEDEYIIFNTDFRDHKVEIKGYFRPTE